MSRTPKSAHSLSVRREPFGVLADGDSVHVFTLTNANGVRVRILDYGGIIQSIRTPDRNGKFADVVLGFDTLAKYVQESPYFGAIVGRFANRIARGRFTLDGKTYPLAINNGVNALHGGLVGFDKVVWKAEPLTDPTSVGLLLTHTSPDGDQGYPGTLELRVTYTLNDRNELIIGYAATTDKPTIINLTNHSYFNLAGAGNGDILKHLVMINADSITPIDSTMIPTGKVQAVAGTPFDFRTSTAIGAHIDDDDPQLKFAGGYDHNFVLNRKDSTVSCMPRASSSRPRAARSMCTPPNPACSSTRATSSTERSGASAACTRIATASRSRPSTTRTHPITRTSRASYSGRASTSTRRRCSSSAPSSSPRRRA